MIALEDIKHFMELAGQTTDGENQPQAALYSALIQEEFQELAEAETEVEGFDAICDLIWVLAGLGYSFGFPMTEGLQEVARSNFSKVVEGEIKRREDGKILKPASYFPPDLKNVLKKYGITGYTQ